LRLILRLSGYGKTLFSSISSASESAAPPVDSALFIALSCFNISLSSLAVGVRSGDIDGPVANGVMLPFILSTDMVGESGMRNSGKNPVLYDNGVSGSGLFPALIGVIPILTSLDGIYIFFGANTKGSSLSVRYELVSSSSSELLV